MPHAVTVLGPDAVGDLRRVVGDRQCLYRRCHAAGRPGQGVWPEGCGLWPWFHHRASHRRHPGDVWPSRAVLCRSRRVFGEFCLWLLPAARDAEAGKPPPLPSSARQSFRGLQGVLDLSQRLADVRRAGAVLLFHQRLPGDLAVLGQGAVRLVRTLHRCHARRFWSGHGAVSGRVDRAGDQAAPRAVGDLRRADQFRARVFRLRHRVEPADGDCADVRARARGVRASDDDGDHVESRARDCARRVAGRVVGPDEHCNASWAGVFLRRCSATS